MIRRISPCRLSAECVPRSCEHVDQPVLVKYQMTMVRILSGGKVCLGRRNIWYFTLMRYAV